MKLKFFAKKSFILFLGLLCAFCMIACENGGVNHNNSTVNGNNSDNPYTTEELYSLAEKSVGEITTYDKNGNGVSLGTTFFISNGKCVTNYHVIERAYSMKVRLGESTYNVTQVLAYDKDIDLAVLRTNAINPTPLVVSSKGVSGGESVYAIGSSEGYTLSFSEGVVASPKRTFEGIEYIQHNAPISSGNSGGPLLNKYGEVVGINTMTNIEGQNLNFAILCSEMDKLSYRTPLSVVELYDKEFDVFNILKNYIIQKGTYDDGEYTWYTRTSYSNDYVSRYTRSCHYDVEDDEIVFSMMIDTDYLVAIYIDEIDGVYTWGYINEDDDYMFGNVYASTFNSSTILYYTKNTVPSHLVSATKELVAAMIGFICSNMDSDLKSVGVTAEDLGFSNF